MKNANSKFIKIEKNCSIGYEFKSEFESIEAVIMITKQELTDLLSHCKEYAAENKDQLARRHALLNEPIAKLRAWGRDSEFGVKLIDKHSLNQLIDLYNDLQFVEDEELLISLLATISNILLANREIKNEVLQFELNHLINRAFKFTNFLNEKYTYNKNLTSVILPHIRLIYLVVVEKSVISRLSNETLKNIVELLETEFKLLSEGDFRANSLVLVDLIKTGYSLLNHDETCYAENSVKISLQMIVDDKLPTEVLDQYANYISFLPIDSLRPYIDELIKSTDLYLSALEKHVDNGRRHHAISVLNFFNHIALLSELLYRDDDKILFETLRTKFIPKDEVPLIYTKLMKALLNSNSSNLFSFAGNNEQMLKDLTLDFYFKIMGNNIDQFVNEMGLLLSMDFVKAKLGHNTKTYAQGEFDILKENTSVYPLHYNIVEENKKDQQSLAELTEEEKEEEFEKLIEIFDKMKKNGVIKMVDNPMDVLGNS